MKKNYSITAIETFIVVAQEKSLTRAAALLHLTPSAVSHRIKLLEAQLNVTLFIRQSKGVKLTLAGKTLEQHATTGINNIQYGIQQSQFSNIKTKLRIAVIPSIGQNWLIPRIHHFSAQHPDIEIEITVSDQLVDFSKELIDAHIHFGDGQYQGLEAHFLSTETVYPVCHPQLKNKYTTLSSIIANSTLLHYKAGIEDRPGGVFWSDWLQEYNILVDSSTKHMWFSHVSMATQGAKYKQGVALGWHKMVDEDITNGLLTKIDDIELPTRYHYFFVAPVEHFERTELNHFFQWLLLEMKRD